MSDNWSCRPILKHKGRPKSKYLKESKWWAVKYLGTVEAVKDWRAPGSRLELMEFIKSAQAANKTSSSSESKVHTPKLLWISPEWLHVTDQFKKKLYALSKTDEIGSFCHASGDDVNHFLVIKVVNAKTGKNDCIILSTQDIVTIRHICQILKVAVESALDRTRSKVRHLMSLKQGHSSHEYEEIQLYGDTDVEDTARSQTSMSPLPNSTVQFLEAEARAKDYDVPSRQTSYSSLKPSAVDSNWVLGPFSPSSIGREFDDYDSPTTQAPHYDQPSMFDTQEYDKPRGGSFPPPIHYKVPRLLVPTTQPESQQMHITYENPEFDNTDGPLTPIYEPMTEEENERVLTIVRRECLSREPILEKVQRDSGHEEGDDSPVTYEPLHVIHPMPKPHLLSDSQEDDSGLEDNDSVEIQIKADIHNEPTEFHKIVQHFAAGDDGDLYAIVEKPRPKTLENPHKRSYEDERQEFLIKVEQHVAPLQFLEFEDLVSLYDKGEADLGAMIKRARLLFRKDRIHLRCEMVNIIRPEQREDFLNELDRQLNYTGSDDLLSSLKKRKHGNPRRRVRFGTVRTDGDVMSKGRTASMESLTTDDSPSSDLSFNDWSSKVMEELNMRLQKKLRVDSTRSSSSRGPLLS